MGERHHRGIIPALAGNTEPLGSSVRAIQDHPRSRGEYKEKKITTALSAGSSPLSRGIPNGWCGSCSTDGIIPALAGNTGVRPRLARRPWDHPRSRGEYSISPALISSATGSSPLSRGIHNGNGTIGGGRGIIPALAGNTWDASIATSWSPDHPRSRGEYQLLEGAWAWLGGSSPLSRGILGRQHPQLCNQRIIPALAGNTDHVTLTWSAAADHPRSRGEYPTHHNVAVSVTGSSPLSRGIP